MVLALPMQGILMDLGKVVVGKLLMDRLLNSVVLRLELAPPMLLVLLSLGQLQVLLQGHNPVDSKSSI